MIRNMTLSASVTGLPLPQALKRTCEKITESLKLSLLIVYKKWAKGRIYIEETQPASIPENPWNRSSLDGLAGYTHPMPGET